MTDDPASFQTTDLVDYGYAPGGYVFNCIDCPPCAVCDRPVGDKRSWRCVAHARKARDEREWRAAAPPFVCDMEVPHA